jgi:glutamyl-tRNA synthetase
MILGPDKKRLSKRHSATSALEYREQGYLPAAFTNYLVRLGWSLGDQEIFTRNEIVKNFSIENLNLSAAVFNPEKMLWMNQEYIMKSATEYLLPLLEERLRRHGLDPNLLPYASRLGIVEELKTRAKTLEEMATNAKFFFSPRVKFDEKAVDKFLNRKISGPLGRVRESIARVDPFIPDGVKAAFEEVLEAEGMKLGKLAQPVRVAVTGSTVSPGIFETLCLLGKKRSLERIDKALSRIELL